MECKVIVIPSHDRFSPAEVAQILRRSPSSVEWWLDNDKLQGATDYRGRRVVLRTDLVIFVRDYLGHEVTADSN